MGGAKSRRKGKSGELEVTHEAAKQGLTARRTAPLQAGHREAYPDVSMDGVPWLWLEAKRYRRVPVNRFCREHLDKERPGYMSCLAWRDDGTEWRATILLSDFLKLVRLASKAMEAKNEAT